MSAVNGTPLKPGDLVTLRGRSGYWLVTSTLPTSIRVWGLDPALALAVITGVRRATYPDAVEEVGEWMLSPQGALLFRGEVVAPYSVCEDPTRQYQHVVDALNAGKYRPGGDE